LTRARDNKTIVDTTLEILLTNSVPLAIVPLNLFRAEEPIMGYRGQAIRRLGAIIVSGVDHARPTGLARSADLAIRA
jgi:hypothetical protein